MKPLLTMANVWNARDRKIAKRYAKQFLLEMKRLNFSRKDTIKLIDECDNENK